MNNFKIPYVIEFGFVEFKENSVSINFVDLEDMIPFKTKRVYTISTSNLISKRGNHAHVNQNQVIICIKGFSKLTLTSTQGEIYSFDITKKAILIPENYWIEIEMQPFSTLLCFASQNYSDLISIFDKNTFLKMY